MGTTLLTENRRNLAPNPRLALGVGGYGFNAGVGGVAAAAQVTSGGPDPVAAPAFYRVTWSVASTAVGGGIYHGSTTAAGGWQIPAIPGVPIALTLSARCSRAQLLAPQISWYTAAGALLSTSAGPAVLLSAGAWTTLSAAGLTAPSTAASAVVGLYAASGAGGVNWAAGDTLDLTGLAAVQNAATAGSYFDGSTAASPTMSYAWTGAAHASASVEYALAAVVSAPPSFRPGSATVWGLGSYDAPDLQFNGVDGFGVEWICGTPEGWKTTSTDVPVQDNPGDGAQFSPGRRKPRTMTLKGAFRCADITQMDAAEGRLRAAVEHYAEDTTLWHGALPTGSVAKQLSGVRLVGDLVVAEVDANPRIRTFTAVLVAADPLKYAAGAAGLVSTTIGMLSLPGSIGATFPVAFPLDFGGGLGFAGRATLINPGGLPVWPKITMTLPGSATGFVTSPFVRHVDLGVSVGLNRRVVPGDVVATDHRVRSLTVNGSGVFFQRITGCTFFPLAAGSNALYFAAADYNAAALATVSYRPAWS